MSNKILIITIFVSNIAFSAVVNMKFPNYYIESKKVNQLSNQIVRNLYNRGLDLNIAKQKLSQSFKGNSYKNELIIKNILKEFPNITQKEVVAYISNSVLRGKNIDLSSYDTIIGIIQSSTPIFENNMYAKVEKFYKENIA